MAEYFCHPRDGDDANPGTLAMPKRSVPHAQTGKNWTAHASNPITVTNGDIVNIAVGTSWDPGPLAADRFVPISGVTYRGYGIDLGTIMALKVPVPFGGGRTYTNVVGAGLWRINGFSCGAGFQAMLVGTTNRINVTLEDMWLDGAGPDAATQVDIGSNSATSGGVTIRRSRFSNAPKVALNNLLHASGGAAAQALLMEDCLVEKAGEDLLKFNSVTNFCSGTHTFRRIQWEHPNWNFALQAERPLSEVYGGIPGGNGDCVQVQATAGRFEGNVLFEQNYFLKEGGGKQWMVMFDALNGWRVRDFVVDGGGTKLIAIGQLRGAAVWERGYFADTTAKREATLFRCNPIDPGDVPAGPTNTALNAIYGNTGTPGTNAVYNVWLNTASVTIRHIVAAPTTGAMFLTLWEPQSTGPNYRINCPVTVENCTSLPGDVSDWNTGTIGGALTGGFDVQTVGGQVACWSSRMVFDTSFALTCRNNALMKTGIATLRLPSGVLNDARFGFTANATGIDARLVVQNTTTHTGVAAMQSAHSAATGNLQGHTVAIGGAPMPGSALLNSGSDLGLRRDYRGVQGRKYIGAFTHPAMRSHP